MTTLFLDDPEKKEIVRKSKKQKYKKSIKQEIPKNVLVTLHLT